MPIHFIGFILTTVFDNVNRENYRLFRPLSTKGGKQKDPRRERILRGSEDTMLILIRYVHHHR